VRDSDVAFTVLMRAMCVRLALGFEYGSPFILVVGDATRGGGHIGHVATFTQNLFDTEAVLDAFRLDGIYYNTIPGIRRSCRECGGTKLETVLVYRKR